MEYLSFVALGLFVYCDLYVLNKQDHNLFKELFHLPRWVWLIYGFLFLFIAIQGITQENLVFFFASLSPVYFIQRYRFRKTLNAGNVQIPSSIDENLFLASDAFGILLLWFSGMVAFSVFLKGIWTVVPQWETRLGELIVLSTFSSILIIFLIYKTVQKYPDITFLKALGLERGRQSLMRIIFLPAVVGLGFAVLTSFLLLARTVQPSTPLGELLESTTSNWVFLSFILTAIFIAPFFEEIVFRGYFFYVLDRVKGRLITIFVIAGLFGLLHFDQYWGDWIAIVMVTLLGFVLTYLRAWTGTSITSITCHFVYNSSMTIIPILVLILSNPVYFTYQTNYYKLDDVQRVALLRESVAQQPNHAPACNDLAWAYAEKGENLDEALLLIERALAVDDDEYAFLDTKAEVLYKMGRVQEAVEIAKRLLKRYPKDKYIQSQLEKFQKELGVREE